MLEDKELSDELLEKVSGGSEYSTTLEGLTYNHRVGAKVSAKYYDSTYAATITKRGYLIFDYYWACVYVVFDNKKIPSGWYVDDTTLKTRFNDGWNDLVVVVAE